MTIHRAGAVFTFEGSTRAVPFQVALALLREGSTVGEAAARHKTMIDGEARVALFAF